MATEYNEGLLHGLLSTIMFGHCDGDQLWEIFEENHMVESRGYAQLLHDIEMCDWLDTKHKHEIMMACGNQFQVTQHMEVFGDQYEEEGYEVFSVS